MRLHGLAETHTDEVVFMQTFVKTSVVVNEQILKLSELGGIQVSCSCLVI